MQRRHQFIAVPLITAGSLLLMLSIWLATVAAYGETWFDGVMRVLWLPGYVISTSLYLFSPEPAVIGQFAMMVFGSWLVWTGIVFGVIALRKRYGR